MSSGESKSAPESQGSNSAKSLGSLVVKIFFLLVVLAIGTVGALYAMGGNEIQLVVTEEIEGKRKDIYKLITDPEEVKKWVEGVKEIELLGDIKDHKVGARAKIIIEVEGDEIELEDEVTFARNNQETEIKMTADQFDVVQRFKLDFKDDAGLSSDIVIVTHSYKCKFKGWYRIFAPFAKKTIEDQLKKNLTSLKNLAENKDDDKKEEDQKGKKGKQKSDAKKDDAKKDDAKKKKAK